MPLVVENSDKQGSSMVKRKKTPREKEQGVTRRTFLALSGSMGVTLLIAASPHSGRGYARDQEENPVVYDWEEYDYVYLIDATRCIGCGMCVQACKRENNVPDGFFRTWVERYLIGEGGRVQVDSPDGGLYGFRSTPVDFRVTKAFFVPKICNICRNAPCIQVCPVGATYITKDGAVLVDEEHCIGCGYCVQACPYGMRFIHPEKHVADKCTLCYHRVTQGLSPACIPACPVGARRLGNLKDENDPVRKIIASRRVAVLQPQLLTEPYVFYIGLDKQVR